MTHPANGPSFPASKLAMLSKAVLAACDKQDGLADGIIGDPIKCSFDPRTLLCKASADIASCLTDSEVSMVQALFDGPLRNAEGERMFPGWRAGSQTGWGSYFISPESRYVLSSGPIGCSQESASIGGPSMLRQPCPALERSSLMLMPSILICVLFQQRGGSCCSITGGPMRSCPRKTRSVTTSE